MAACIVRKSTAQKQGQPCTVAVPQAQFNGGRLRASVTLGDHVQQLLGVFGVQQLYKICCLGFVGIVAQQLPKAVIGIQNTQRRLGGNADHAAVDIVGNVGKALVAGDLFKDAFAAQIQGVGHKGRHEHQQLGNDNKQRAVFVNNVAQG